MRIWKEGTGMRRDERYRKRDNGGDLIKVDCKPRILIYVVCYSQLRVE